jgi:hypothetical protein
MKSANHLPRYLIREIAVTAECDERSVAKVISDLPTRSSVRARVHRALRVHAEKIRVALADAQIGPVVQP